MGDYNRMLFEIEYSEAIIKKLETQNEELFVMVLALQSQVKELKQQLNLNN